MKKRNKVTKTQEDVGQEGITRHDHNSNQDRRWPVLGSVVQISPRQILCPEKTLENVCGVDDRKERERERANRGNLLDHQRCMSEIG